MAPSLRDYRGVIKFVDKMLLSWPPNYGGDLGNKAMLHAGALSRLL